MDFETPHYQPQPMPPKQNEEPNIELSAGRIALQPTPVVKVLSPAGIEYVFLTILLMVAAIGLIASLLVLINGKASFSNLSLPAAVLLITVPSFAGLFLRLKKMELHRPELRFDPSKRRSTQFVQVISFLVSLLTLIVFVYALFAHWAGQEPGLSIGKAVLNALCVLVVSGGILAYYWHDEHKFRA